MYFSGILCRRPTRCCITRTGRRTLHGLLNVSPLKMLQCGVHLCATALFSHQWIHFILWELFHSSEHKKSTSEPQTRRGRPTKWPNRTKFNDQSTNLEAHFDSGGAGENPFAFFDKRYMSSKQVEEELWSEKIRTEHTKLGMTLHTLYWRRNMVLALSCCG